ncbi:MAG TPA: 50S ribosomal protein L4 [Candidatus Limnocylindria bacterium]|nr:50S ribosomal protein L4 [Candidatus Limnocylindria bacterium]
MTVSTFTKTGTKAPTAAKLDKAVFDVMPENHELIKTAYVAHLANGRENLAKTKTRGLVRGGGKKPWKQKGTGRARFGSSRNPIWRGGGIAFGPTGQENYTQKLHVTAKRQAIRQALSLAASAAKLVVLEDLKIKDNKTSEADKFFAKVGVTRNALVVVADKTDDLVRATRNLPYIRLVQARYVNVFDVMNADTIVITRDALAAISDWLGEKK